MSQCWPMSYKGNLGGRPSREGSLMPKRHIVSETCPLSAAGCDNWSCGSHLVPTMGVCQHRRHSKDGRVAQQRERASSQALWDCSIVNSGAVYLRACLLYEITNLISGQCQLGFLLEQLSGSLKMCSQAQEHSITWGLVRNANSQARPPESETVWSLAICVAGDSDVGSGLRSTQ